ncbi:flagellar M-ring protein FliF [Bryocella elongata]|uniref:Flagellar M-ring protein n=1 Tax=Bryocella elongata TaxID=863522 RepID=A0A1H5TK98_9BACT|nr:flagellar basal-body MS-ring/collar protein FliF [Bryocella elongata]SEF62511.1 flagellar M-ring protein FliF [Bryocella elongata]
MAAAAQIAKQTPAGKQPELVQRLTAFWNGRTGQQKIFLGIGVAITVAAAAIFTHMVTTPDMKPLMSGLDPADAKTITTALDAKKIPYTLGEDGTSINVAAEQLAEARLEVASQDKTHSGHVGYELFDKTNWGETEFDEKVNYQRAIEGELERTIGTIRNVKAANVHLVMATESVFMDRQRNAKASVTLRLKDDGISREEVKAIQRLVAGAVDQLKPGDVVVIDADSERTLSSTGPDALGGDDELEQGLSKRLMATLAPVVGAQNLHASVNVEYETNSSEENDDKYDPQGAVPLSMQKTEETSTNGAGVGGVPGTSSNVPSAKAPTPANGATPAEPSQSSKSESASYGVNRVTRHILAPAGGIRRLTAAIVVDDVVHRKQDAKGKWVETRTKRTPEELKLIAELAQASIGYSQPRGDVVSVQNLSFDRPEVVEPAPLTLVQRTQKQIDGNASLIRYGVLFAMFGLVYLLMIRPIQKRALGGKSNDLGDGSLEKALPSQLQDALPQMSEATIAERTLALKKELTDFVEKDPDSGATAIRAWLKEGTA